MAYSDGRYLDPSKVLQGFSSGKSFMDIVKENTTPESMAMYNQRRREKRARHIGNIGIGASFLGAPILGKALGGGLMGAAGAGGIIGGGTSWLGGGDPIKGALTGAAGGAAGYGLNSMMSGSQTTPDMSSGSGGSSIDWPSAQANAGGITDSPVISEAGAFDPTGSEIGGSPRWLDNGQINTQGPASTINFETGAVQSAQPNPISGFSANPGSSSIVGDPLNQPFTFNSNVISPEVEDSGEYEGTSYDSGMDFGAGGEIPVEQQMPQVEQSLMDKLREAYKNMKDPLAMAGAMGKMYMGNQHADELRKALAEQKAGQFDNREFDQLARDFQDPAKRMAMVKNAPGYKESQDFLMREQQRKLAQKGNFSQLGQGDAMSNNWAVPMADVVAKNAMNFDNALFGQIKDLTGMTQNNSQANASLTSGFLPKAASMEDSGWKDLLEALRRNQGFLPDALKTALA